MYILTDLQNYFLSFFLLVLLYIGNYLFFNNSYSALIVTSKSHQKYGLGVVVWPLSRERSTYYAAVVVVFATALLALILLGEAEAFSLMALPLIKKSHKRVAVKKRTKKRTRVTKHIISRTIEVQAPGANPHLYHPQRWLQLLPTVVVNRRLRKKVSCFRGRVVRPRGTFAPRVLTTLVRKFHWRWSVNFIPRLHFYAGRLLRWPLIVLFVVAAVPFILHTLRWFVQDYELTYRNISVDHYNAYLDLREWHADAKSTTAKVFVFFATLVRMYLNALEGFYFARYRLEGPEYGFYQNAQVSYTWLFLLASFFLIRFLYAFSTHYRSEVRHFRKYSKRLPHDKFTEQYYRVVLYRTKQHTSQHTRPIHPDKGRSDDWCWLLAASPSSYEYIAYYLAKLPAWFDTWVAAFRWAHLVMFLFTLTCFFLYAAANVVLVFTRKILYRQKIAVFVFARNFLFSAVFGALILRTLSVWFMAHSPRGGWADTIWAVTITYAPWYAQLFVIASIALCVWYVRFFARLRTRTRRTADTARVLYTRQRIMYNRTNRRALEQMIDRMIASENWDRSTIRTAVVRKPRRKRVRPESND